MAKEQSLIDADATLEIIAKLVADDGMDVTEKIGRIIIAITESPTVDSAEVVHGWWIELPGMEPDYKCSECGRSYAWWEPSEAHYCPNCGAKMDRGVFDG